MLAMALEKGQTVAACLSPSAAQFRDDGRVPAIRVVLHLAPGVHGWNRCFRVAVDLMPFSGLCLTLCGSEMNWH